MNIQYETELYRHGILGQKWGVRRYQNPDGSLTSTGKKRYSAPYKRYKKKFLESDKKYRQRLYNDENLQEAAKKTASNFRNTLKLNQQIISSSKKLEERMLPEVVKSLHLTGDYKSATTKNELQDIAIYKDDWTTYERINNKFYDLATNPNSKYKKSNDEIKKLERDRDAFDYQSVIFDTVYGNIQPERLSNKDRKIAISVCEKLKAMTFRELDYMNDVDVYGHGAYGV